MNKLYLADIGFHCSFKDKNGNNNDILEKYKFEISENIFDKSILYYDRENDYLFLTLDERFYHIQNYIINNFLENNRKIFYKKFNNTNYRRITNYNNYGYITKMDMYIELTDEELFYIKLKYDISLNN